MIPSKSQFIRPKVILSSAISLDGQIATRNGDVKLSNTEDWKRVHQLRALCDAIMVGSGTIMADDSKLTVNPNHFENGSNIHNPIRIVVSSDGNIPLNARVITYLPDVLTIIATTHLCTQVQKEKLEEVGCRVISCGNGSRVNLQLLLTTLSRQYKIKTILLEGGSILNGSMITEKLIDEIHLAIAPVIGGQGIPFFKITKNLNSFEDSPFFEILNYKMIGDMIWVHLKVQYKPRQVI